MSKTLAVSVGKYGGFYAYRGDIGWRVCLGWVAVDYLYTELDKMFRKLLDDVKAAKGAISRWRTPKVKDGSYASFRAAGIMLDEIDGLTPDPDSPVNSHVAMFQAAITTIQRTDSLETFYDLCVFWGNDYAKDRFKPKAFPDSRATMDIVIDWANEFNTKNLGRQWDGEYMEEIEQFYDSKVAELVELGEQR